MTLFALDYKRAVFWNATIAIAAFVTGSLGSPLPRPARTCSVQADALQFDPTRYLPPGGKIRDEQKDVVFADLCADGKKDIVVFYSIGGSSSDHKAAIMVLRQDGTNYERFWEGSYEDSWGFAAPSGVYDLNGTGKPQIVAYRTIGASCPGILDIYECVDGGIKRITGHWADNGQCQSVKIEDLNGDGIPEIIVRTRNYGVNEDIYCWRGGRYVKSDGHFPEYYNAELREMVEAESPDKQIPASWRLGLGEQIVGIYLIQRRFDPALKFAKELLRVIRDPNRTSSDLPEGQATASVNRLIAKIYRSSGDLRRAREYETHSQTVPGGPPH